MSPQQFAHWLATTDAKLEFIGPPPYSYPHTLASRDNDGLFGNTTVTYCSKRAGNLCGGICTVYNGGPACIDVPHTECMAATGDVGFCDEKGCNGNCNNLSACGTHLKGGFCFTFGTKSIVIPVVLGLPPL